MYVLPDALHISHGLSIQWKPFRHKNEIPTFLFCEGGWSRETVHTKSAPSIVALYLLCGMRLSFVRSAFDSLLVTLRNACDAHVCRFCGLQPRNLRTCSFIKGQASVHSLAWLNRRGGNNGSVGHQAHTLAAVDVVVLGIYVKRRRLCNTTVVCLPYYISIGENG